MICLNVSPAVEGVEVPVIERPWTRVRTPVPIPAQVTTATLAQLGQAELAELIRSNFVPRTDGPNGRAAWEQLWALLKNDDELAGRAFDVLEDFLDITEDALEAGTLEDAEASRARKFKARCEEAWKRLDRMEDDSPLAWAGKAGEFQPSARKVISILVGAIARHRSAVLRSGREPSSVDQQLWDAMRRVDLDPRDYQHRSR